MLAHDELLIDFIAEAWESIDRLDQGVVQLEKTPEDQNTIAQVFRAIHTIKGSSGFFGLKRIERLSHAAETLLGNLRDGRIPLSAERAAALLMFLDNLRQLIAALEADKQEPPGEDQQLIERLRALSSSASDAPVQTPVPSVPAIERQPDPPFVALDAAPVATVAEPVHGLPTESNSASRSGQEAKNHDTMAPVKVSVELLDEMVNNVSELVLARNRLLPYAQRDDRVLASIVASIDRLTLAMQERVLKTRMQTIGQLWSRIPRVSRDLALACGKEVEVVCRGQDTELDRSMLDALKDPEQGYYDPRDPYTTVPRSSVLDSYARHLSPHGEPDSLRGQRIGVVRETSPRTSRVYAFSSRSSASVLAISKFQVVTFAENIAYPLRAIFRRSRNVRFRQASVAEVDHHELWQRARLTVACVARGHRELNGLLDGAERCGEVKVTEWGGGRRRRTIPPTCARCLPGAPARVAAPSVRAAAARRALSAGRRSASSSAT